MKTFRYTIKDADGAEGTIILNETEAYKLCGAMTKDLYGTEAVVDNIQKSIRMPRSYDRMKDVPYHMHVKGARQHRIFKRMQDGQVRYWSGTEWSVSSSFWYDEEQAGGFFVEFFGDLPGVA